MARPSRHATPVSPSSDEGSELATAASRIPVVPACLYRVRSGPRQSRGIACRLLPTAAHPYFCAFPRRAKRDLETAETGDSVIRQEEPMRNAISTADHVLAAFGRQTENSNPGAFGALYDALPDDIPGLCHVVQNCGIHLFWIREATYGITLAGDRSEWPRGAQRSARARRHASADSRARRIRRPAVGAGARLGTRRLASREGLAALAAPRKLG